MAPIDKKRKDGPTNDSFVRSKKTLVANPHPHPHPIKRQRKREVDEVDESAPKASQVSRLSKARDEEKAFPRGGASLLTPLEHKQIKIEATRDVLFEQQAAKSTRKIVEEDDAAPPVRQRAKSKTKRKEPSKGSGIEEESIRIEGLSYSRLVQGSLVLGQVSQINEQDIALSLPNNLTGYVPVTSISDAITRRIEAIAAADAKSTESEDEEQQDTVEMSEMFRMGQYLRAHVVSTSEPSTNVVGSRMKRRIELSLHPQQSNNALSSQDIVTNATLMASVLSVEDHGLIMDLGLKDPTIRGFMPSKEIAFDIGMSATKEGMVFLCVVTGHSSNGNIVKLSADLSKAAKSKRLTYLADAPTIDPFLPGTAVEILVAEVTPKGIAGKIIGMMNATADLIHSGAGSSGEDLVEKYKIGSKIKGRIICTFPGANPPKLGVSLLNHVISMDRRTTTVEGVEQNPLEVLALSTVVEEVRVSKVVAGIGLFVDVGVEHVPGFVHISRVKDGKIDELFESSGPYKVGAIHRGRIIGYNSLDGLYLVSLEQSILEQKFLGVEDVPVGQVVDGTVERLIANGSGIGGVLVKLAEGVIGLVPEIHLADVQLLHPEKKFKETMKVTARVLSTDPGKRQIRLTLKKSLVHAEADPFIAYDNIKVSMQSPGTIVNIVPAGAYVQFYGRVRGFLPVSEMSEAYIQDPKEHFRKGQVVNVHVLKINAAEERLVVSCKDPLVFGLAQQTALKDLKIGEVVSAAVTEINTDSIFVELRGSNLRCILPITHLTDGSDSKNKSALKKIRIGQTLTDLVVIEKLEMKRFVCLSNKPSLLKDTKAKSLLINFDDVQENKIVHGFIREITPTAVFVQFGGGLVGLLPKTRLLDEALLVPNFSMTKGQSIEVRISSIDRQQQRFVLSMRPSANTKPNTNPSIPSTDTLQHVANPVDDTVTTVEDLQIGRLTKARVLSVKETQLNVQLADNIQGRIDVSEIFDSWDEIKDRKYPLRSFSAKQVFHVRVLGTHDSRNHRFLPITYRSGKNLVFELSAKPCDQTADAREPLILDKVDVGSSWVAYVNNISNNYLWVNLSPNIRGRIRAMDVSDDVSLLNDLESNFPIGSAIRVHVVSKDVMNNRLDLSAISPGSRKVINFENITTDMVLPGKVTKVEERQIIVQLTDSISAPVHLPDLSDDFSEADTSAYSKNDIIRVSIVEVDRPNRQLRLSTRPSRVLNSTLAVKDPEVSSITDLEVSDIVRGFVKNVYDGGLFVNLGARVTAYVRVADLSDSYVKDWKAVYHLHQLVKGKIISIDSTKDNVRISLKASVMDKDYKPAITFDDLKIGQVVSAVVRKVEDFGVFIVIDGSANVSGLCHQSEMAEKRVHDVKKLYSEGDSVKAIILKKDENKKRISFGLKASYFDIEARTVEDSDDGMQGVLFANQADEDEDNDDSDGGVDLNDVGDDTRAEAEHLQRDYDEEMPDVGTTDKVPALEPGSFDWNANIFDMASDEPNTGSEDDIENEKPKRKKRRKAVIKIDHTGDLDANGTQSVSDFERLLLGQPNSSQLWTAYMAFQINLSEVEKAREIAQRAIKTISVREDTEKMNMWIALLNLEMSYGSDNNVDDVFKQACQYNDPQEIHERLASSYILAGKHEKADTLFQATTKKFSQSPVVWYNYGHFLHTTLRDPDRARALLPRAMQYLPPHTHLALTLKFAALEFHSPTGSPERGRTMFEGVLATFPKRLDIWNQLLDLEVQQGDGDLVRGVFERVTKVKGLKPKGAKACFKRWSAWEDEHGDEKSKEVVKRKAEEWVRAAAERKKEKEIEG